jgi:hypothetical protein
MARKLATILAAALLFGAAAPARARRLVVLGGVVAAPAVPYPYYPYGPPVGPFAYWTSPDTPPPGWEPAHWEWRADSAGRSIAVWVPAHLR